MDFDRLRCLAALQRTGSMRAAAAALSLTPGAVSKAIARLEVEAGVPLVEPDGRGVQLTHAGAWLARRASFLVGEHASIADDLATRRFRTNELCVATYDAFAAWLPAVLARQFLPDTPLSLRERWPGEVEAAVADAISDAGITFTPVPTEGVVHEEVARVRLGIYTRRGAMRDVRTTELPYAIPSHPLSGLVAQYGPLDGWPADAGSQRTVQFRASSLEARLELCRLGLAAVLIPEFVAERHDERVPPPNRLERRDPPPGMARLQRRVWLVRRAGDHAAADQRLDAIRGATVALCAAD